MLIPLRDADAARCGAKAAALATMLRAELPVPEGFVLPFDVNRSADGDFPGNVRAEVEHAYAHLGHPVVVVRSSASLEDISGTSSAGVHESILGVRGIEPLISAIRRCWGSLNSERARAYREASGTRHAHVQMAVIVQRMVDADVSGVLFTPAEHGASTLIESSWGLGPTVVEGRVTPDRFRIAESGSIDRKLGSTSLRIDRSGSALVSTDVARTQQTSSSLNDAQLLSLARLGATIARLFAEPQDVEWAIDGADEWIVQSRPITAIPPAPRNLEHTRPSTLNGAPASAGTATGTARVIRGPQDFSRTNRGDILVCPSTDPSWTPLLLAAAGVVTERGGILAHAAIVAREQSIPAVLGVAEATVRIADGAVITVDGDLGTVTLHEEHRRTT